MTSDPVPADADGPLASAELTQQVGERIACFRIERGLKVAELARRVGVTGSLISQIERGRSRPSISTLFLIGEALDVPIDAFFRDEGGDRPTPLRPPDGPEPMPPEVAEVAEPPEAPVPANQEPAFPGAEAVAVPDRFLVRSGEGMRLQIAGGVQWQRLTPDNLEEGEFTEVTYAPGVASSDELYRHTGSEWVHVLEGELEITVGFTVYRLGVGDSLCFPSSMPHRYANPTERTARAISVNLWDQVVKTLADASRGGVSSER